MRKKIEKAEGWVTIEGTHVHLDDKGTIDAGPPNIEGKPVNNLPPRESSPKEERKPESNLAEEIRPPVEPTVVLHAAKEKARESVLKYGKETGKEKGVFLNDDGTVVGETEGHYAGIEPSEEIKSKLLDPANKISIVHNHPRSQSLSGGDVGTLAMWPGMKSIEAVAQDGSGKYVASRGPNFPKNVKATMAAYQKAYDVEREKMLKRRDRHELNQDQVDRGVDHNVMLNLAKKGIIKYEMTGRSTSPN